MVPSQRPQTVLCHALSSSASREASPPSSRQRRPPPSRISEQVARDKIDYMSSVLDRLSECSSVELRQAFLYWLSQPARTVTAKMGQATLAHTSAMQILDFCLEQDNNKLLETVIQSSDHLYRLFYAALAVPRETARASDVAQAAEQLAALERASSVWTRIEDLVFPPDLATFKAHLTLWNRRIKFLAHHGECAPGSLAAREALGGQTSTQGCLQQVQEIVDAWQSQKRPALDAIAYGQVLTAYAHSKAKGAADGANALLQRVEDDPKIPASVEHYVSVLLAYSHEVTHQPASVNQALAVWERLLGLCNLTTLEPDSYQMSVAMSIVLSMLAKTRPANDVQEALDSMEARSSTTKQHPNLVHYNTVLTAWAKSRAPDAGDRAESLLHRMMDLGAQLEGTKRDIQPNRISYTAALEAILWSPSMDAVDRALAVVSASEETDNSQAMPDTHMYIVLLRGLLARQRREGEPQVKERIALQMETVLDKMMLRSKQYPTVQKPVADTYCLVLNAWSASLSASAPKHALALIEDMETNGVTKDAHCLELALKCLSLKPYNISDQTVEQAQWLWTCLQRSGLAPTIGLFNEYIRLVCQFGRTDQAKELLRSAQKGQLGVTPDEESYEFLIEGCSKSKDGVEKATRLLVEYVDSLPPGASLPLNTFGSVMNAWAASGAPDAAEHVETLFRRVRSSSTPNGLVYGALLRALQQSGRPDAPQQIEQLLAEMEADHQAGSHIQPNAGNFAVAIKCWARSRQAGAAERAEAILNRLEALSQSQSHLRPNLACYRGVIQAWSLSGEPNAGERALAILDRLDATNLQVTRECYKDVIRAIGTSCGVDKAADAYSVLQRMRRDFRSGNRYAQPSPADYVATLRAIANQPGTDDVRSGAFQYAKQTLNDYLANRDNTDGELDVYLQILYAAFKLLHYGPGRDAMVLDLLAPKLSRDMLRDPSMQTALDKVVSRRTIQTMLDDA